jgi:RHS repeat-associated protein
LYKAFGETRYTLGNLGTDYKFTGQREEASLGIYFFNARWMDPSLGRFTSPDTIVPTGTQGTQAWDRYAFVNNNPVRYNDPTGHQMTQGDGGGATCGGYGQPPCDSSGDGGGEGDGTGGGGGKPKDSTNSQDEECHDWICVDADSEAAQSYWDANNLTLETLTKISKFTGSSALMSAILSLIAKGAPIFTAKTIALIFGVAVADPTPIVELLLVVAVVTAAISLGMTFAGDDLQNVNNALVKSGAYQNGGTISASPMSLTITTSTGTTTVNSQVPFVSMLSLYIWAEGYYP